jgi:atypical dual specificity phosphatase
VDIQQWFTPKSLLDKLPNVGIVIDLSATSRYYDPKVFADINVKYTKVLCVGQGIPNEGSVDK